MHEVAGGRCYSWCFCREFLVCATDGLGQSMCTPLAAAAVLIFTHKGTLWLAVCWLHAGVILAPSTNLHDFLEKEFAGGFMLHDAHV